MEENLITDDEMETVYDYVNSSNATLNFKHHLPSLINFLNARKEYKEGKIKDVDDKQLRYYTMVGETPDMTASKYEELLAHLGLQQLRYDQLKEGQYYYYNGEEHKDFVKYTGHPSSFFKKNKMKYKYTVFDQNYIGKNINKYDHYYSKGDRIKKRVESRGDSVLSPFYDITVLLKTFNNLDDFNKINLVCSYIEPPHESPESPVLCNSEKKTKKPIERHSEPDVVAEPDVTEPNVVHENVVHENVEYGFPPDSEYGGRKIHKTKKNKKKNKKKSTHKKKKTYKKKTYKKKTYKKTMKNIKKNNI